MAFNPAGTRWSVAAFDDNGKLNSFHPTPWEFHEQVMNAGDLWVGGYTITTGDADRLKCQNIASGETSVTDTFEVHFVTPNRFIATKDGSLYRFGKRI
ncbi:hypothetical protein [Streptosporangium sp. KLBMP 9127]|nr:hypothetical protein [Streptosporangium sp. KLBMP 9127]